MGFLINQNDFTHGELEPRMLSKSNLELYRKGAQLLRNMVVLPTGAAQRRPGTLFIKDLGDLGENYMLDNFIYDEDTSYLLVFTNLLITVFYQDAQVATIVSPWPTAALAARKLTFSQTQNSMIICHEDYAPYTLVRGANHATWTLAAFSFKNYPGYDFKQDYDSNTFKLSATVVGTATLTSSVNIFDASYVGGWFEGYGKELSGQLGVAKITGFTDAKNVTVEITSEFDSNFTTFKPGSQVLLTEPAFSATRGYPICSTFYEGRLYFGGSKSLPDTIFGSVIDDFRNFDVGTGDADDAVQMTIGGHKVGLIKYILGDKSLQIFTSRAEFTAPQVEGRALTPSTFSIKKQSANGCKTVPPVVLDNQTFYVKRGGRGVMNFIFDDENQGYSSQEVSLLSPHLIQDPQDAAILSGSTRDNADFMFLVNGDGTLAIYQSKINENVSAWTLSNTAFATDGKFTRVVEVGEDIYFGVERTVDGSTSTYLEKLDFDVYTDSTYTNTYGVATDTITGLGHLEGEEVQIRGDGFVLNPKTVSGGEITLEREVSEVEVGLKFIPQLKPMPIATDTQSGNNMYKKKKIINLYVDYYESLGIYINDTLIPELEFGLTLDSPPPVKTDVYEALGFLADWNVRDMITITQEDPLPMTIIGIGFEVTA